MHDLDYLAFMWPSGAPGSSTRGEAQWICGDVAGAVCAQCHRVLLLRLNTLTEENERLRETIALLRSARHD